VGVDQDPDKDLDPRANQKGREMTVGERIGKDEGLRLRIETRNPP
jgi:hypothetical protein